jgi:hypothetical protein|tara:strand:+ start:348 stop:701 length:354 start_codon:yes stop_codon:yes gene_type:complete
MTTQRHITAADDVERIYGETQVHLTVESFAAASGLPVEFVLANGITSHNSATGVPLHELRPDPHAKRRQADGRNAWKKLGLTPGAREEFVGWLLENGLKDVVHFQAAIIESFVEVSK